MRREEKSQRDLFKNSGCRSILLQGHAVLRNLHALIQKRSETPISR